MSDLGSKLGMAKKSERKKPSELDGATWLRYSISVWNNIKKTKEENALKHPAMFPTQLVRRFLKIYAKCGETTLDPFLGSGSTLVAAKSLGINGIGFDINPEYIIITKKRLEKTKLQLSGHEDEKNLNQGQEGSIKEEFNEITLEKTLQFDIHQDNAKNIMDYLKPESINVCITSPPYWDIHRQKRTADLKQSRPYSESKYDIGNIKDYDTFLNELQSIFRNVFHVLKKGARCIIACMDIRKKAQFYPFHMDLTDKMREIGFHLEDIVIWDRRKDYSNLRPLGYPYVFRVNKIHEFLMIYLKPSE